MQGINATVVNHIKNLVKMEILAEAKLCKKVNENLTKKIVFEADVSPKARMEHLEHWENLIVIAQTPNLMDTEKILVNAYMATSEVKDSYLFRFDFADNSTVYFNEMVGLVSTNEDLLVYPRAGKWHNIFPLIQEAFF